MNVRLLKIVVASPGDVQAERELIGEVAAELNRNIAADRGLRLEVARWETDAYPGFHPEGPQGLIDPILSIDDCDILIGIFWKRFGTPTKNAKSGTEHEFRTAYETWQKTRRPQIMVYFNQAPYRPTSKTETDQWGQVLEFKSEFPKEGLWWPYKGKRDFEKLVRGHLIQFIRQQYKLPDQTSRKVSGSEILNKRVSRRFVHSQITAKRLLDLENTSNPYSHLLDPTDYEESVDLLQVHCFLWLPRTEYLSSAQLRPLTPAAAICSVDPQKTISDLCKGIDKKTLKRLDKKNQES